jgi:Holliday junction resolvase RusA-like endonuclease
LSIFLDNILETVNLIGLSEPNMTIKLIIEDLAPSLNGSKGLMRMHFHAYRKVKENWILMIRAAAGNDFGEPFEEAEIEIVRHYARQPLDIDNLYAACKVPLDAMRHAGILIEDDPSVVTNIFCHQVKVAKVTEQKTEIKINGTRKK